MANKEEKFSLDYCRKIILNRFRKPTYKVEKFVPFSNGIIIETQKSASCSDAFSLNFVVENNVISQCQFSGFGCVIAVSTLDLLLSKIINHSLTDALNLVQEYLDLLANKIDPKAMEELGDLWCFNSVYKQKHRVFCATVGASTIAKFLAELTQK